MYKTPDIKYWIIWTGTVRPVNQNLIGNDVLFILLYGRKTTMSKQMYHYFIYTHYEHVSSHWLAFIFPPAASKEHYHWFVWSLRFVWWVLTTLSSFHKDPLCWSLNIKWFSYLHHNARPQSPSTTTRFNGFEIIFLNVVIGYSVGPILPYYYHWEGTEWFWKTHWWWC